MPSIPLPPNLRVYKLWKPGQKDDAFDVQAVELTHANLAYQIRNLSYYLKVSPGERTLSLLPPWHIYERSAAYYILSQAASQVVTHLILTFQRSSHGLPPDHQLTPHLPWKQMSSNCKQYSTYLRRNPAPEQWYSLLGYCVKDFLRGDLYETCFQWIVSSCRCTRALKLTLLFQVMVDRELLDNIFLLALFCGHNLQLKQADCTMRQILITTALKSGCIPAAEPHVWPETPCRSTRPSEGSKMTSRDTPPTTLSAFPWSWTLFMGRWGVRCPVSKLNDTNCSHTFSVSFTRWAK